MGGPGALRPDADGVVPHPPPTSPATARVLSSGPTVKVLIADDDRLVRTMLGDLLRELGHEVVAAENGVEAVALCGREQPEVVVLDLLMPRLSGLDALRAMREAGCSAPAIMLTAISDRSFRDMEGADAIQLRLDKPVTRRALERAISRAVGGGR
jgi:two-component system, response regulator PdtaR